jgi:hypothetical protein
VPEFNTYQRINAGMMVAQGPNLGGDFMAVVDPIRENFPRAGAWCARCHRCHRSGDPEAVVARCGGELAHRPRLTWRGA